MKKWLLIIFIPLAVVAIVTALLPSQFQFEESIVISVPREDAYDYLVNLEYWKDWSPWLEKEPSAEFVFVGIPGVVGSHYEWSGKEIGTGRQTLTQLREPEFIETHLNFTSPSPSEGTGYVKLADLGQKVEVTWGLKTQLAFPFERIMGLILPSLLKDDFQKGLKNLKNQLEKSS